MPWIWAIFVLGAVMPPIVLLAMAITPGVPVPADMPLNKEAAPVSLIVMLPVAVPLPIVFPVVVPQLNDPVVSEIPCWDVLVLDVVRFMFAIVFPCKLVAVVVPTDNWMPRKIGAVVSVHAVPPALAAPPPIKLFVITKLFPDAEFEIKIPLTVTPEV